MGWLHGLDSLIPPGFPWMLLQDLAPDQGEPASLEPPGAASARAARDIRPGLGLWPPLLLRCPCSTCCWSRLGLVGLPIHAQESCVMHSSPACRQCSTPGSHVPKAGCMQGPASRHCRTLKQHMREPAGRRCLLSGPCHRLLGLHGGIPERQAGKPASACRRSAAWHISSACSIVLMNMCLRLGNDDLQGVCCGNRCRHCPFGCDLCVRPAKAASRVPVSIGLCAGTTSWSPGEVLVPTGYR